MILDLYHYIYPFSINYINITINNVFFPFIIPATYFPADLGSLEVTYSPRDPRFAGSNPTEVDGFFQDVKILNTSPPGGTLIWGS